MDWAHPLINPEDDMAERERLGKERDSEREREIKTERQADGFTLLIS